MKNKIFHTSKMEMSMTKKIFGQDETLHVVEINGENILVLQDYLSVISELFKFPIPSRTIDGYNDWMCDLEWFKKDKFVLIINHYDSFLNQDLPSRKIIMDGLGNLILPWWQKDVEKFVVEGKAKSFNIYLVE